MRIKTLLARISALAAAAALGLFTALAAADSPAPETAELDIEHAAAAAGAPVDLEADLEDGLTDVAVDVEGNAEGGAAPAALIDGEDEATEDLDADAAADGAALTQPVQMQVGGAGLGADLFRQEAEALLDIARAVDIEAGGDGGDADGELTDADMLEILDLVETGALEEGELSAATEGDGPGAAHSMAHASAPAAAHDEATQAAVHSTVQAGSEGAASTTASMGAAMEPPAADPALEMADQDEKDAPIFDDLGVDWEQGYAEEIETTADAPSIVVTDAGNLDMYGAASQADGDYAPPVDLTADASNGHGGGDAAMADIELIDLTARAPVPASSLAVEPIIEVQTEAQDSISRSQIVYQGVGGPEQGETVYTAVSDADAPGETVYVAGTSFEGAETIYVARRVIGAEPEETPAVAPAATPKAAPAPLSAAAQADAARHHDLNREAAAAAAQLRAALTMAAPRRAPPRPIQSAPAQVYTEAAPVVDIQIALPVELTPVVDVEIYAPVADMAVYAPASAPTPAVEVASYATSYAPAAAPASVAILDSQSYAPVAAARINGLAPARASEVAAYLPATTQNVRRRQVQAAPAAVISYAPAPAPVAALDPSRDFTPGWTPPPPSREIAVMGEGAAYSAAAAQSLVTAPMVSGPKPVETVLAPGWSRPGASQEVLVLPQNQAPRRAAVAYRPAMRRAVQVVRRPVSSRRVIRRVIRRRIVRPSVATTVCAPYAPAISYCPR